MLEGITAGLIFSLTLFPGVVWLVKVGVAGSRAQVVAVGLGFAVSNLFWLCFAISGLMMMSKHLGFIRFGMHLFASFVLLYVALKFLRSKRVARIDDAPALDSKGALFTAAFRQSLAMPLRLPVAMAILLATGMFVNHVPDWETVPKAMLGACIGVTCWWGQMTFLSAFFAKRVAHPISVRSLNKIRPFCGALSLILAGVVLFLGIS